ncbi:hypothetical protein A6F53_03330 [Levilactobacillus brevis]|uniref:hypothetical protein n=1 Tax=Levilactobacillus brevis TaxID=1580 RepID=UPI0007F8FB6A|nr:hypothetical protein [Levilactobacillus brevis]ANN48334.1 hypothetical protein A6F53_03330 [Levilactobacillus brevis]
MTKRLVLIAVGTTVLLTGSLFTSASAKTKRISKISNVRVTGSKVYGHTTKYANIKLLSTKNKSLGHSKANKKGNFIIKTKKSLKKVTFKFKVTKRGFKSSTYTFKNKLEKSLKSEKTSPIKTKYNAEQNSKPSINSVNVTQVVTKGNNSVLISQTKDKLKHDTNTLNEAEDYLKSQYAFRDYTVEQLNAAITAKSKFEDELSNRDNLNQVLILDLQNKIKNCDSQIKDYNVFLSNEVADSITRALDAVQQAQAFVDKDNAYISVLS